jgi:hypothetical protein
LQAVQPEMPAERTPHGTDPRPSRTIAEIRRPSPVEKGSARVSTDPKPPEQILIKVACQMSRTQLATRRHPSLTTLCPVKRIWAKPARRRF